MARRVADVGPAVIVYHSLTDGAPIDAAYLESGVDEILMPIVRP
ncbi:hypothetical protein [Spirillospora sp. NBC_01491]|nr:hypothetical protein [Spirillospora sp. NBC_01491]